MPKQTCIALTAAAMPIPPVRKKSRRSELNEVIKISPEHGLYIPVMRRGSQCIHLQRGKDIAVGVVLS